MTRSTAGDFHFFQQTIVGQWDRPVWFGCILFDVRSLQSFWWPNVDLGVNNGHGKVKALGNRHQAIVNPGFRKNYRLVICRC